MRLPTTLFLPLLLARYGELAAQASPPPVQRELRGAWIATVSNIDWPSTPGASTQLQQDELRTILDRMAQIGLNAVILQVRPAADALYESPLEPWSEYLTGEMGKAPEPYYDPLAFAVDEAHARGLELHAWFNPFRARHPSARSPIAERHVSRTRPDLVRRYGTHLWLDPCDDEVREHSVRVVLDVVRRYDVDGVHIDDYFYPYKERDSAGALIDFPDTVTWRSYVAAGGAMSRDDWRRSNVDRFVEQLYRAIKAVKPTVKFGVSPFGIWRPGHPPSIKGFDPYQEIYADARKWLEAGWLDYLAPQLYWAITPAEQSYPTLLSWWVDHNPKRRHIWPGSYTSRIASATPPTWHASEILHQIALTRRQRGATGNIHFSARALMQNRDGIADSLRTGAYAEPALVPPTRWLDAEAPAPPSLRVWRYRDDIDLGELTITFTPAGEEPRLWILRERFGRRWHTRVLPGWRRSATIESPEGRGIPHEIVISTVDRSGNESRPLRSQTPDR